MYSIDGMICDALEDVVQVSLWIDAVEFARLDQAVEDRRAISAAVGSEEHVILARMESFPFELVSKANGYVRSAQSLQRGG